MTISFTGRQIVGQPSMNESPSAVQVKERELPSK
jgi:hypothetical protein